MLDWRRNQFDLKYEVITLESPFEDNLLKFHHSLDIIFGVYDFIVDKYGNYVFLEVNPAGQWLWLEHILGTNVSQVLANVLLTKGEKDFTGQIKGTVRWSNKSPDSQVA